MSSPEPPPDDAVPASDEPEIATDAPPAPPMEASPTDSVALAEQAKRAEIAAAAEQAKRARDRRAYLDAVEKGKKRVSDMHAAVKAASSRLDELEQRTAYWQNVFDKEYRHGTEPKPASPTKSATWTRWLGKQGKTDAGYLNTPLPKHGRFLLWESVRDVRDDRPDDDNETMHVSDICFYLYKREAGGGTELPPLESMFVEAALAGAQYAVYDHMATRNSTGENSVELGTRDYGTDDYYAILGSANAIGPIWMVIDHGHELGIAGISHVTISTGLNLTYHFVPRTTSGPSSTSSSSSSTSTSHSSGSSTSSTSSTSSS